VSRHVVIVVIVYALGFVAFWPRGIVVIDECDYINAAKTFADGKTTQAATDALSGTTTRVLPSSYPPGTSALAAPLVGLFGVRAAPLVSLFSFCVLGLLLARWLALEGRSPIFALLFLGYLPAVALGRVAMSDVPSALVVCAAQLLLFRSAPREGRAAAIRGSFAAGLLAGLSLVFRETNALFLVPLFIGAIARREGRSYALVSGAMIGVAVRLVAAAVVFGNPFFTDGHRGWSFHDFGSHVFLYLVALLILAPLGFAAGLAYRGDRRAEIIATVLLSFFSSQRSATTPAKAGA
jgi:4-amino-4-deoxy-L-arabinose transferase-like glycosyltransferase